MSYLSVNQNIDTTDKAEGFCEKLEEYKYVESLVLTYQARCETSTEAEKKEAMEAATILLQKFSPLFKKYLLLLQTAQINFKDGEQKRFVLSFIGDPTLKAALKRDRQSMDSRQDIIKRFCFVLETYGKLGAEDIMTDLQMLFLQMARRYRPMGKNFCAYIANAYGFEVSRHIKKFIKNPVNIAYKNGEYEDYMQFYKDEIVENCFEDKIYENNLGIPDMTWITGTNCSDIFGILTPFERKIILKYYLEDFNDRQIAEEFGLHINTCNQKRRQAVIKLAHALGVSEEDIKRNRNSGKHALAS